MKKSRDERLCFAAHGHVAQDSAGYLHAAQKFPTHNGNPQDDGLAAASLLSDMIREAATEREGARENKKTRDAWMHGACYSWIRYCQIYQ